MEELNSLNKLNSLNSLNKLGGQGSGSQQDIGIEELLYVAQSKGGRLAEVANELSGRGTRSILSTIGNKFKTTFNDFVDIISIPGQVVAGVISKDFTVAEAIKENKRVSDAIFGDTNLFGKDGTPTTMQKIGDFVVRLPVDIITDPLTYLTFGASSTKGLLGKMGFKNNVAVSLEKDAAAVLGKTVNDGDVISRVLSDYGQDVYSFQQKYANAIRTGSKEANLAVKSTKEKLIKSGVDKSILDAVQKNTKALLRETIDAKFDVPLAQKVMSNIMSKNPALVETLIDKGGIKFAGKTILDAQRVGKIAGVIPGMKWIDEVSLPLRNSVLAKFDTGLMKVGSDYVRLPEHVVTMRQQLKNISESMNIDLVKNLDDIQRTANLNESEIDILVNSISNKIPPADMRLQNAYYKLLGIKEGGLDLLRKAGIPVSLMDNHVGLISVPNDSRFIRGNSMFGKEVGSQMRASYIAAVPLQEVGAVQKMDEVKKVIEGLGGKSDEAFDAITTEAKKYKSAEEFVKAQPTFYRGEGGSNVAQGKALLAEGKHLASDAEYPKGFGKVGEYIIKPDAKVLDLGDSTFAEISQKLGIPERKYISPKELSTIAKEKGYGVLKYNGEYKSSGKQFTHIVDLTGDSTITKSQLTDTWNKAQKATSKSQFPELLEKINKARTVEDVTTAIGEKRDSIIKELTNDGKMSLENAVKDSRIVKLDELQSLTKDLKTEGRMVGRQDKLGLSDITGDPELEGYLIDNSDKVFKRVATTAQELHASGIEGFDKNLLTAFTTREMQNIRQSLGHEFAQGLVRNFGRWSDEAPDSWVTMSSSLVNDEAKAIAQGFVRGDGVEMKFHPAVAKMFDEMVTGLGGGDEVTKGFMKSYDNIQSYYKSYLTTVFPMFHGRNAISNVLLNFLDMGFSVFDPRKHFTAINLIKDDRQINKLMRLSMGTGDEAVKASQELLALKDKTVFTDVTGYRWKLGELRDVIRKNDIAFNPNITGSLDVRNDYKGLSDFYMTGKTNKEIAKARLNPLNADQFAPTRFGRDVLGRTIEEQSRLVNFMKNLMDTGDVTHAAKRTKQFLFDYSNLTKFEKDIMRRIMPFYSFCVPDSSEILTKDGWKNVYELEKNDDVLSYNMENECTEWDKVQEIHKFDGLHEVQHFKNGRGYEFIATRDHRWVTRSSKSFVKNKHYGGNVSIKKGYELNSSDNLIQASSSLISNDSILSVVESSLLGWLVTDGYHRYRKNHFESMIYQSPKKHANKIREMFKEYISSESVHPDTGVICFRLKSSMMNNIKNIFKSKEDLPSIVTRLNRPALEAMYEAMIDAEGSNSISGQIQFTQKPGGVMDSFQIICQLLGLAFNIRMTKNGMSCGTVRNFVHLKVDDLKPKDMLYRGVVWCPVTKNQTWVMRQNGIILITGNTRKNLELQAKTLMTAPGKIASEIKTVNSLGSFINGEPMTEEERKLLPKWMQNNLNIKRRREDGKYEIVSGFGTPIEQPFQQFQAQSLLGSLSPLIKIPIEQMTGYNMFRGKMTSDVTDAKDFRDAPEAIKDFIGYQEWKGKDKSGKEYTVHRALRPDNMQLIMSMPYSRFISTMSSITDKDVTSELRLLQSVTGVTARSFDEEQLREQEARELLKDLEKILRDSGIRGEFKRGYNRKDTTTIEN